MTVFADSSAIVKLYADEPGHDRVRAARAPLVVSALARVEVAAALWRKHRIGELSLDDLTALVQAFDADWGRADPEAGSFVAVAVTTGVIDLATRLVGRHGLRAYDGIQLASALLARDALGEPFAFAAFDQKLCEAAAREGLALLS